MNIERLFHEEIRDKKRIGSNIFSRVSTRKGGGNQALRTPSYFMKGSNKYKKLSGDVEVYNLNDVISYQEFQVKNKGQQRMFMEAWKSKYKGKEIQDMMGISKNVYYKILEELDIPTNSLGQGKRRDIEELTVLSDEDMAKYMDNFIDFSLFKNILKHQQFTLLEKYLQDFPVQSELAKAWDADLKYVYYINSCLKKQKEKQEQKENDSNVIVIEEPSAENDTILSHSKFKLLPDEKQRELLIHWRNKYLSADIKEGMGISDGTLHSIVSRLNVPRIAGRRKTVSTIPAPIVLADEKLETVADGSNDDSIIENNVTTVVESEDKPQDIESQDTDINEEDNIIEETRQNEENDNSLTIEIKGNYSTNAIMKSIQSILTTLEDEEEIVNIDLKVRKR